MVRADTEKMIDALGRCVPEVIVLKKTKGTFYDINTIILRLLAILRSSAEL